MKKKSIKITLGVLCIGVVLICLCIQFVLNKDTKKLEKEEEKLKTLTIKTKSNKEIECEYVHVEDNQFYIKIPKKFQSLEQEIILKKYSGDVPDIVFSNEETTINVAISLTENKIENNSIKSYIASMEKLLKNTSNILDTKIYKVDGHTVGQMKLITPASDTDIYNNMLCFSYQGKLVIVTFNCTIDLMEEWQDVGDFIIDSLFFKE